MALEPYRPEPKYRDDLDRAIDQKITSFFHRWNWKLTRFITRAAMVVFVIWLGVYPQTFLEFLHVPVQLIIHRVTPSLHDTSASVQSLAQLFHFTKGLF